MTSTVTEVTLRTITSMTYDMLTRTAGLIVILLLLLLLGLKEILRSSGRLKDEAWMRAFDVATLPLLLTFGFVIFMRFMGLLR